MKKLESLTQEQQDLMAVVRQEWIDRAIRDCHLGIDEKQFEEGIEWLYTVMLEKPKPRVIYCDSWMSCLQTILTMKSCDEETIKASIDEVMQARLQDLLTQYTEPGCEVPKANFAEFMATHLDKPVKSSRAKK